MKLSELKHLKKAVIINIDGSEEFRRRITEMGFVKGQEISLVKHAPLKDPIVFSLMDYNISLRKSEAELIEIRTTDKPEQLFCETITSLIKENKINVNGRQKGKRIKIVMIGNPNSGKTTLFNSASDSHGRTGNFDGATVDYHQAKFQQNGYTFEITDLPGIYSMSTSSSEELFARKWILDKQPDVVVNVVDASNLERNLFLTTQLIDLNIDVVMALNMFDEVEGKNLDIDIEKLSSELGMPVVPTIGTTKFGVDKLFTEVENIFKSESDTRQKLFIDYDKHIGKHIAEIEALIDIDDNKALTDKIYPRYLAIKALENDAYTILRLQACKNYEEIQLIASQRIQDLENHFKDDGDQLFADMRYKFISNVISRTTSEIREDATAENKTLKIDSILTHQYLGFPLFIFFMWLMFQSTFTLGGYPNSLIQSGVALLADLVNANMAAGPLKDLLVNGLAGTVFNAML